jgi:hypothetical protein
MKIFILVLFSLFTQLSTVNGQLYTDTCSFRGVPLYGKVRIVTSFPTFKVRVVQGNADYNILLVTSFPDKCAKWKIVTSHEDFTVMFVKSHEDFTIRYVSSFPGK